MYCHHCGEQLPGNAKFCSRCGTKVKTFEESKTSDSLDQTPIQEEERDQEIEQESQSETETDLEPDVPPIFQSEEQENTSEKGNENDQQVSEQEAPHFPHTKIEEESQQETEQVLNQEEQASKEHQAIPVQQETRQDSHDNSEMNPEYDLQQKFQQRAKSVAQNGPENEARTQSRQQSKQSRFKRILPILLPVASLIVVAGGLLFYYFQEKGINEEVLALKKLAEEMALQGDYEKATDLLEDGLLKRPDFTVLEDDLATVERAMEYKSILGKVSKNIQKTEFDAASKDLASLKEKLSGEQGPLFEPFHSKIEDNEVKITIGTIKKELNELKTIDELGSKLSILATLPKKEANAVREEILNKIVQISSDEAETQLTNKDFSDAFATIDKGLQYASNNEKLLSLKDRVEQDRLAFEKAEQQRIEQAMEAAAKEDLKNRTAAVSVSNFLAEISEYGDLYIYGDVENVATTSVSSVTIYYSIYDEDGVYLSEGSTSVYPYNLEPGDMGSFEDIYYGVYETVNVEIDNITWYLN